MANKRKFIKSSSGYVRKSLHQLTHDGVIYEHDYMTITEEPNFSSDQIQAKGIYGDSNFIFTIRKQINGQYNVLNKEWLNSGDGNFWTAKNVGAVNKSTDPSYIKPYFSSLTDFAYYGSSVEMVRSSITEIINKFPGGIYCTEYRLDDYFDENGEIISTLRNKYLVNNPFDIDISSTAVGAVDNPYRFMCLKHYEYCINNDNTPVSWAVEVKKNNCSKNGDLLRVITFSPNLKIYVYYVDGEEILCSDSSNVLIRPHSNIMGEFYDNLSDFTKVLLNRETNPKHKSQFETYYEDENGKLSLIKQDYIWPMSDDNYNIDIHSTAFSEYLQSLINMASFYDEVWTDSLYRMLTHESIKNLDWTFNREISSEKISNDDLNFSKIQMILRIYGRQLDEIKRYIDNIGFINNITYNQENNPADNTLINALNLSGWEVKNIFLEDDGTRCNALYNGEGLGYTITEANNEFLRRLKLNSSYIFSQKGTKKGLKTLLSIFGMVEDDDYTIIEKIYETNNLIENVDEIKQINKDKTSFHVTYQSEYGDLSGIPVKEVDGKLVPWFDIFKNYDSKMYFEMAGGWDCRDSITVNDIKGNECILSDIGPFFKESQKVIKYFNNIDELLSLPNGHVKSGEYVYVYYIDNPNILLKDSSHYFYLHNVVDMYKMDTTWDNSKNISELKGWYPISTTELTKGTISQIGEKLLYYLSFKDETVGNNPHYGNKKYDCGESWRNNFKSIFKGSIEDMAAFKGVNKYKEEDLAQIGFDLLIKDVDSKTYVVTDESESCKKLNSKQIEIIFNNKVYTKKFIEEYVLFYLKQIIPATTIFKVSYKVNDMMYGITIDNN